ncbi:MAG: hypothetical protein OEL76_14275 [Siculibacillus sp.]|nr:hypothetical protein [Siculibacillus sp.]
MAVHMVKVAYEGAVTRALKNAEAGLTSGGAVVYEIRGVPAEKTIDDVVDAVKRVGGAPKHTDHEVDWADIAG